MLTPAGLKPNAPIISLIVYKICQEDYIIKLN